MSNEYLIERRMKHHKLQRKARRGEIAIRRIYKLLRFLFVLFIFYSIYRLGNTHYWYLPNDIYTNPKHSALKIVGNRIVSNEKIIETMKTVPIDHKLIYKIHPDTIAKQIENLEPIKRAYVRRFWLPTRLVVMIEEYTPAIVIAPSEDAPEVLAFAMTGEIIPKEYLPLKNTFSTVKILSYGNQGDDYIDWDKDKIQSLNKLSKYLKAYSGEEIEYIDLRQPHNVFVQLKTAKIRLGEIDESVYERIKSLREILAEVQNLNENIKYIDLAWETKYLKLDK